MVLCGVTAGKMYETCEFVERWSALSTQRSRKTGNFSNEMSSRRFRDIINFFATRSRIRVEFWTLNFSSDRLFSRISHSNVIIFCTYNLSIIESRQPLYDFVNFIYTLCGAATWRYRLLFAFLRDRFIRFLHSPPPSAASCRRILVRSILARISFCFSVSLFLAGFRRKLLGFFFKGIWVFKPPHNFVVLHPKNSNHPHNFVALLQKVQNFKLPS